MGGGGSATPSSQVANNQTYNYQGGSIELSNLLGNLNYKSSGDLSSVLSRDTSAKPQISTSQTNSADSSGGAGGGSLDVAASVGVGVGGGSGSAGAVDKTSSYDYGKTSGSNTTASGSSGIPSYLIYAGAGIAGVFVLSKMLKKKGKK